MALNSYGLIQLWPCLGISGDADLWKLLYAALTTACGHRITEHQKQGAALTHQWGPYFGVADGMSIARVWACRHPK